MIKSLSPSHMEIHSHLLLFILADDFSLFMYNTDTFIYKTLIVLYDIGFVHLHKLFCILSLNHSEGCDSVQWIIIFYIFPYKTTLVKFWRSLVGGIFLNIDRWLFPLMGRIKNCRLVSRWYVMFDRIPATSHVLFIGGWILLLLQWRDFFESAPIQLLTRLNAYSVLSLVGAALSDCYWLRERV